ncbi:MAG: GYF domain-containing protein [Kofleriaceae bacterium]
MKIVCDACQAKYSISDDKVQGKVFKIRCKKCSNIIVVRGGAGAAEPAPVAQEKDTRVYDYGYDGGAGDQAPAADDAVWHLVINQDQVGPMTVAEVQQRFASGEVDAETFTWREGFADWLPLAQVDVFSALVVSGSTTSATGGGGGGAAAIGAMFGSGNDDGGTSRSDPGDLFAAASSGRASQHEDDDGGDLFGAKPAAAASSGGGAAAANAKMRGERNENSVLFSLNNLAQLASDKPAISTPSSQSGGAGHATGAAGGEGSGLIDIRSMASAYMGGGGASMGKAQTASSIGSIDDLPVFGGGGFSEPAVLVPTVRSGANNKMMYMMIAAVSLLAVVAIIMVVILMKGGNKPAQVATAETGSATAKPENAGTDTKGTEPAKGSDTAGVAAGSAETATKPDTTATKPDTTTATTPETKKPETTATVAKAAKKPERPATTTTHTAVATSKPDKKPETTTASKPDSGGGGCDEVSCVLNNYEGSCCSKFRKGGGSKPAGGGAAKPSGGADLPDGLDRSMISSGIANVKARVSSCGDKSQAKGKVKVHVKVGGDGRVANVTVESAPDASLGACVQAAVSKASFSKTQSGGSFSYPFVF